MVQEWAEYLEGRGHEVRVPESLGNVLLSRNGRGKRYRWLLLHEAGPSRRLTPAERETVERQTRLARKAREQAYLVLKFERPEGKVVVLPMGRAISEHRLSSDKGGIPWD